MSEPEVLDALERELAVNVMLADFREHVRMFWSVVDPAHPFEDNTATNAITLHLQAVADGSIDKLGIALPPGLGKTTLAILWCGWLWARDPSARIIYASYAHTVAQDATAKVRRLVEHERYQAMYPRVQLRADQNRLDDIGTTANGRLYAAGVGGALTSVRADYALVDDSLNAVDAFSKPIRERANTWFDGALLSRIDGVVRVVAIQQRLHALDLIGHVAATGDYELLVLPAEFDPARRCRTSLWEDPRTEPDELLAPAILPRAKLDEHRKRGSAIYSCQYLQNPIDQDGGILRRELWSWYKPDGTRAGARRPLGCSEDAAVTLPTRINRVVIAIDTAFKGKETSDYFVAIVAAIVGAQRFVLELVRRKMNYGPAKQTIQDLAARYPGCTIVVEDSASGTGIVSELGATVPNLIAFPTGGRSKEERVQIFASPPVEARQVFLPEGAGWLDAFVSECAEFPRGAHDDVPDALAMLLNYASSTGRPRDLAAENRGWWRVLGGLAGAPPPPTPEQIARIESKRAAIELERAPLYEAQRQQTRERLKRFKKNGRWRSGLSRPPAEQITDNPEEKK